MLGTHDAPRKKLADYCNIGRGFNRCFEIIDAVSLVAVIVKMRIARIEIWLKGDSTYAWLSTIIRMRQHFGVDICRYKRICI